MLGDDGVLVRPAKNALADRHRVNAELAEGCALELAIGRVILDPLHVAAETIALVQHRDMTIGKPRAFVEMAAGKFAQTIKMRLDVTKQCVRQMDTQEIGQRRIGAIKVHPRRVRREQPGPRSRGRQIASGQPMHVMSLLVSAGIFAIKASRSNGFCATPGRQRRPVASANCKPR